MLRWRIEVKRERGEIGSKLTTDFVQESRNSISRVSVNT